MSHDQNGRVNPPRCEECNAPLGADDGAYLCQECEITAGIEAFLEDAEENNDAGCPEESMFLRNA